MSLDSTPRVFPSKKSRSISRCVLERTRARERGRKRNFRNCRNAINSVAGYRGYRGLRRKFRPNNQPCRSFSSTSPHLSLSLSPHFLLPPSPFSGEAHRRDRHTTGHIGIRRGYGEHDEDPLGAAWKRDSYEGRAARRRPYIPDVHTGRIPVVDTYNRRKELASRYGRDDRTHSRGHRRTAALNHPSLERGRESERFHLDDRERSVDTYLDAGFSLRRAGYGAGASEKMVEKKSGFLFPSYESWNGRYLAESGKTKRGRPERGTF